MADVIGAFEAKNTFGTLLDRVERGEEVAISRHGRLVARLVPNNGVNEYDHAAAVAAMERILARATDKAKDFDWPSLKADRDAGRP